MIKKFVAIDKDARDFGFDWPDIEMIFDQILSELEEVKDAIAKKESTCRLQEEIGDLIATSMSLCIFAGFDVEETMRKQNEKFGGRMKELKRVTKDRGLESLKGQTLEASLELWNEVKRLEKIINENT